MHVCMYAHVNVYVCVHVDMCARETERHTERKNIDR